MLCHYHPTPPTLLRGAGRTWAPIQPLFGDLDRPRLLGFHRHNYDVSSIFWVCVPPTEGVIVERRIFNSEVSTRVPKTPTLKLPKRDPALINTRKVNDCIGVILHISRAVDRHLRGAKLSEDGLQPFAIVDDRHLLVDGNASFIQNDGVVEIENQDTGGLQFVVSVLNIRFLTTVPVRATPDIPRIQARSVQTLVLYIDKVVVRYSRTSQPLNSVPSRRDSRMESR